MRISPVGWVADSEEEVKYLSRVLTEISHNHLEGIKGAEAIAMAVYLARIGKSKEEIKERMIKDYYPQIKYMTVENIRPNYGIDDQGDWVTCQGSVPHSLVAFFDSTDFEDAVRMASESPAKVMGCFDRCGSLEDGKDADIVIMNKDFKVTGVWQQGVEYTE